MKKWAKILMIIGIVYLIILIIFFVLIHLKWSGLKDAASSSPEEASMFGLDTFVLETLSPSVWNWLYMLFIFGLPSWIIFVIIGIWESMRTGAGQSA